jgi:hypothetical protein
MIPPKIIKDISDKLHSNYGDSDKTPSIKPILILLIIVGLLYLMVYYF